MYIAFILIAVLLLAAGAFFMIKFLRNVQPDDMEIVEDLKVLKASVAQYKGGFVSFDKGISAADIDQIVEKSNQRNGKGVFMSTDNSPIFAYAFRSYIGPSKNNLIYVISNDHEYVFRTNTKGTEVTIDGTKIGLLRSNGIMYDIRNNEIAQVKRNSMTGTNTVLLNSKEVAKIALPENIGKIEAIEITGVDLNNDETEMIRTLSIMELISSQKELQD
jgi:hypothetical protein